MKSKVIQNQKRVRRLQNEWIFHTRQLHQVNSLGSLYVLSPFQSQVGARIRKSYILPQKVSFFVKAFGDERAMFDICRRPKNASRKAALYVRDDSNTSHKRDISRIRRSVNRPFGEGCERTV